MVWQFSEADLRRLAGDSRFERGQQLVDAVDAEMYDDEFSVCGTVRDGQAYLAMVHHCRPMSGECPCPDGGPPHCCEHSVAVGLAYLYDYGVIEPT
ncbi:MAG: SWIM zinc finger family protein [Actinomycetota bacterium]